MYTVERPRVADSRIEDYEDDEYGEDEVSEEEILAEAIENIDEVYALTIQDIDAGEEEGQLSYEEAEELRAQAYDEYEQIVGLEEDDEADEEDEDDEDEDYADGGDTANFFQGSSNSQIGQALMELINEDYGDLEEGIAALCEVTGYDAESIAGILVGEYIPDQDLVLELAGAFNSTDDEEVLNGMLILAEDDALTEGDYEDDDYEDDGNGEVLENYARAIQDKDFRLQELEAEFAEAQVQREVSGRLSDLNRLADIGFQQGWLPPVVHRELMGGFDDQSDQLAAFSSVCQANGADLDTELYAMQKTLEMFQKCEGAINFSSFAYDEPLNPVEEAEENAIQSQARRNADLRIQQLGR